MWIEAVINNSKVLIATCYRQQSGAYSDNFWEKAQNSYDKAKNSGISNIIMTGDFNVDPQTNKDAYDDLMEFLNINSLSQFINEPTRITVTQLQLQPNLT